MRQFKELLNELDLRQKWIKKSLEAHDLGLAAHFIVEMHGQLERLREAIQEELIGQNKSEDPFYGYLDP